MRLACCAYRIPGHGLAVPDRKPEGQCPGVEDDILGTLDWQVKGSRKANLIEALQDVKQASGYTGHSNSKWKQGSGYTGHSNSNSTGKRNGQGKGQGRGKWH